LRTCVNAVDCAIWSYPLSEESRKAARPTADIENMITGCQLQIVREHPAEAGAAAAQ
jgi:hypothetical protein